MFANHTQCYERVLTTAHITYVFQNIWNNSYRTIDNGQL